MSMLRQVRLRNRRQRILSCSWSTGLPLTLPFSASQHRPGRAGAVRSSPALASALGSLHEENAGEIAAATR
ncbi:hypothetical protein Nmel_006437 [Mimus melanotis]